MSPQKSNNDADKRTRSQSRRPDTKPSPTKDGPRQYKTQGMVFGNLDPVAYDRKIDPFSTACFNCWGFNHNRKFCTQPKTYEYCCNCGRKDLTVEECPRCARAFQGLNNNLKDWIYQNFYTNGSSGDDGNKQTTTKKKSRDDEGKWNNYDENNYQSLCPSVDTYGETAARNELNQLKNEDFGWVPSKSYYSRETAYAKANDLFTYMRSKKIRNEFETDKLNNGAKGVNLDDTRMDERDSFGENSVVSIDDTPKKDHALFRLTGEPLRDFLNLLDAVKHLSVRTQDVVVLQFMSERKQKMAEKEVQFINKSKSP